MTTAQKPSKMRVSVLAGPSTMELQDRPVPTPGPDEVLVRVGSVGVCGSDVHYYKHGRIADMVVRGPLVLGHEVGGRITAVGSDVPRDRVGERVALEPQRPCRRCRYCKSGQLNLCPNMEFFATPPIDGAFSEYVVVPADFAHPVPDSLSDAAGGLLEPLSVGIWANQKAGTTAGSRVFITGGGPIGALAGMAARAMGATDIVVSDPVASRRPRGSERVGATVVDPTDGSFDPATLEADVFLECAGPTPALRAGVGPAHSRKTSASSVAGSKLPSVGSTTVAPTRSLPRGRRDATGSETTMSVAPIARAAMPASAPIGPPPVMKTLEPAVVPAFWLAQMPTERCSSRPTAASES